MKRAEVLEEYTVEDGIIVSPGRYEQEPIWAPAVDAWTEDGQGERIYTDVEGDDGGELVAIVLHLDAWGTWGPDDPDWVEWPELRRYKYVSVEVSEQGFVSVERHKDDPTDRLILELT